MRLEDTDTERSKKEFEEDILSSLSWLGLTWDSQIYRQSERSDIYKKHLLKLIEEKKAFWCYHTKEELEAEQKQQIEKKEPPRHICDHQNLDPKSGRTNGIIRLAINKNSDRIIAFEDQIRGRIEFKEALLGNFAIARNLDSALYHFTVTVDDGEMDITHVIRGEDHISNTPKQILIYEALGMSLPLFAHLPLLLGPDRSKLSKRHGSTAVSLYRKDYLSDAIFNFLAGTSYTFSKDIISKEEMIKEFDLAKIHKSGAVFDIQKLNWINSQYVKKLGPQEFLRLAGLEDKEISNRSVKLINERLEKLSDTKEFSYLWTDPDYNQHLLKWKNGTLQQAQEALLESKIIFSDKNYQEDFLKLGMDKLSQKLSGTEKLDRGLAYWPVRVALSGKEKSADPINIALAIGQEETLKRLDKAILKLK